MKKTILISLSVILLSSCSASKLTKSIAYKGIYEETPLTVLIMPPINRSTNIEAKEYFHSTILMPLANAGYYVVPSFLSMEILKKESAYDSELFIDTSLDLFKTVFGADIALFTIIHKWDKGLSTVKVEVEYIIKSTKSNRILYSKKGQIRFDTSVSLGGSGVWGALANLATSAVNTAATKYVDVARVCNAFSLEDLPQGKYGILHLKDGQQIAGKKIFKKTLNAGYHK